MNERGMVTLPKRMRQRIGYGETRGILVAEERPEGILLRPGTVVAVESYSGMNRGDRLQTDRGHGLHIDWGLCPGKMSYQWNRNNDLLIWRKAVGLR